MTSFAGYCMLAHGWRRALLLILAGALAALSAPPLFALPALFVALPVWVWSLDGAETGRGWRRLFGVPFLIGFWFGLGYFLVALHWIGAAFFVDGGWVLAVMPVCLLALCAVLALFWGLASAIAHLFWSHRGDRILALAAALAAAEFARGHLLSGFPFDLLGYALTANDQMMQAASLVGVYGLTLVAALVAMTPALIWPADKRAMTVRLVPCRSATASTGSERQS
jgi:apolipoprotein N-acyltransferase